MKKIISALLVVGWVAVASAGTPPSLEEFVTHGRFYRYDSQTKEWKFKSESGYAQSCNKYFEQAAKDGVADALTVEISWDTPLWKAGPHTVKELRDYCATAQKDQSIESLVDMADMVGGIE